MNMRLCASRRFTTRPPATMISCRGRMNRKQAMDFRDFHRRHWRLPAKGRARNGIQNIDRHDVHAEFFQGKRQIAPVLSRFTHAQDAAGANLYARLLQVPDGLHSLLVGMRRADLGEEPCRRFEVMIVALDARLLQAVGHVLVRDHSERGIRPRFPAFLQALRIVCKSRPAPAPLPVPARLPPGPAR